MSNEYPPRPTKMNQPSINGNIVASDVYDYYINNELHKAIDEYWQSKYKTFAKGRIKRMRSRRINWKKIESRTRSLNFFRLEWNRYLLPIKRWNRH